MHDSPVETSAFAIDLDSPQSQRLIERALRRHAEIALWPNSRIDEPPLTGPLAGHTRDGLLVHPGTVEAPDRLPMISEYCEASFRLDDSQLMFTTNVLDLTLSHQDCSLEIARPEHLRLAQRRRFQRRALRGSTTVRVISAGKAGRTPIAGALLNIGTGGMACRIERSAGRGLRIDAKVRLSFTLPESDGPFALSGRIRGKTPGAKPEHVILAIEFAPGADEGDEIERLSEALYTPLPALA